MIQSKIQTSALMVVEQITAPACIFLLDDKVTLIANSYLHQLVGTDIDLNLETLGLYPEKDDWLGALSPLTRGQSERIFRRESLVLNGVTRAVFLEIATHEISGLSALVATFEIVDDKLDVNIALKDSHKRFRATFENSAIGMAHVSLDGRWLEINKTLVRILGYPVEELLGTKFSAITHEDDKHLEKEIIKGLTSYKFPDARFEKRYIHLDGSTVWAELSVSLERQASGRPDYFVVAISDISKRKRAEKAKDYLAGELAHRTKNLLGVVSSIAFLTRENATDIEDYTLRLNGRIQGLARAIDLVVSHDWSGTPLDELCKSCLAPFSQKDKPQITISGKRLILSSEAAQALGLAIYELATNSLKHGALSCAAGNVAVSWEENRNSEKVVLSWVESNGPVVTIPSREGYGTFILRDATASSLKGTTMLDYDPGGFSWTLETSKCNMRNH